MSPPPYGDAVVDRKPAVSGRTVTRFIRWVVDASKKTVGANILARISHTRSDGEGDRSKPAVTLPKLGALGLN